jgi:hypothetical protein
MLIIYIAIYHQGKWHLKTLLKGHDIRYTKLLIINHHSRHGGSVLQSGQFFGAALSIVEVKTGQVADLSASVVEKNVA